MIFASIPLLFIIPRLVGHIAFIALSTPVLVLCLSTGVVAMRRGYKPARVYLLTWGVLSTCVGVMVLANNGVLPSNLFTDQIVLRLGSVFQVLLFSLVLAQRVTLLRKEVREANEQLVHSQRDRISAQEEALAVKEEAAATLQRKVDERTEELLGKTREAEQAHQDAVEAHTEAVEAHAEADEARHKIAELDRQKTAFFTNVSHELRTPLTLILSPLDAAESSFPDDPNILTAARNSRRLLRLVNQLLDFQKLSAGKKDLESQPINVVQFARACGEFFASACAQRGIEFQVSVQGTALADTSADVPHLYIGGEADALEKVVFNYLSNALKYTPSGGDIHLDLSRQGAEVRICVADSGPGIRPEDRDKLFKLFSQVDGSTTRAHEGTGLGLALVKELTELMGGKVGVASRPGQGSRFWCDFPALEATPELIAEVAETQIRGKDWLLADASDTAVENDNGANQVGGCEGRILVIDDLSDMRALISQSLAPVGYDVVCAGDGHEGLSVARAEKPELIITDWMMPGMSGLDFILEVRNDSELAHVPVILLTAHSDEEGKLLSTEAGADAFLGKPFNEQELHATVRNLLALKRREKEVEALNRQLSEHVLKRFLPPEIVDRIVSGEQELEREPSTQAVTILFADLAGFTRTTRTLRTAKMARILNDYLAAMNKVVFEHGGTVDKFIGDSVMVLFGAPTEYSPPEQVSRASRCAAAMQRAMAELNARWKSEGVPEMQMRIGLHHGPAVVGHFGSAERLDYTAIGNTVNIGSRIETACEPGKVFVSAEVSDYLPEDTTEDMGLFSLKGIEKEVRLYSLKLDRAARMDKAEDAA